MISEELSLRLGKKIVPGMKIKCLNPEHDDKNPSMHIYEDHAYCFSCQFVYPPNNKQFIAKSFQFSLNEYAANVERFHKVQPFFYDRNSIFWLWDWDSNSYKLCDEVELTSLIDKKMEFQGSCIKKHVRTEYIEAFKIIGRRSVPKNPPPDWIQFGNFVTNLRINGNPWGEDGFNSTPDYFFVNPIPWDIGSSEDTPVLDKLFKEWVGDDNSQTLYEIIAYCCYRAMPIHLAFALIGSGRNGKSVFQQILLKFLGKHNCVSTELDTLLDSRFESFKLYKKLACQLGETNWGVMKKTSLLKKLTGGDLIGYEMKNKNPFDDYNYSKIIINSNSLPSSDDTSEGFYRRWFILEFPNDFPEGKDIFSTIPDVEYNNLARKSIRILKELLECGRFTNQGTIEERKQRYLSASNPLPLFIDQYCKRDYGEGYYERFQDLFNSYKQYLIFNKRRVVSRSEFNDGLVREGLFPTRTNKKINDLWVKDNYIEGIKLVKKVDKSKFSDNNVSLDTKSHLAPYIESEVENSVQTAKYVQSKGLISLKHLIETKCPKIPVPIEQFIEQFIKDGYSSDLIDETIKKCLYEGFMYEPQPGLIAKL